jgi:hypothetical protein
MQMSENSMTNEKRTVISDGKSETLELLKFFSKEEINSYFSKDYNINISKKQKTKQSA